MGTLIYRLNLFHTMVGGLSAHHADLCSGKLIDPHVHTSCIGSEDYILCC